MSKVKRKTVLHKDSHNGKPKTYTKVWCRGHARSTRRHGVCVQCKGEAGTKPGYVV